VVSAGADKPAVAAKRESGLASQPVRGRIWPQRGRQLQEAEK
jgi:hypothetical protein